MRSGAFFGGTPPVTYAYFTYWRYVDIPQILPQVGDGISVNDMHVVNTINPLLSEVSDEKVTLLI